MLLLLQAIKTALTVLLLQGTVHVMQQTGATLYIQQQALGAAQHIQVALFVYQFPRPSPAYSNFAPISPSSYTADSATTPSNIPSFPVHPPAAIVFVSPNNITLPLPSSLDCEPLKLAPTESEAASTSVAAPATGILDTEDSESFHEPRDESSNTLHIQRSEVHRRARQVPSSPASSSTPEREPSIDVPPLETVEEETVVPPPQPQPTASLGSDDRLARWLKIGFFALMAGVLVAVGMTLQSYRMDHGTPDALPLRFRLQQEIDSVLDAAIPPANTNECVDANTTVTIHLASSKPFDDRSHDPVAESSAAALRRQAAEAGTSSGGNGNIPSRAFAALQALLVGWSALSRLERSGAVLVLVQRAHPCVKAALHDKATPVDSPTHPEPLRAEAALLALDQLMELWTGLSPIDQTAHLTSLLLQGGKVMPLAIEVILEDEEKDKENKPPPSRVDKGKGREYYINKID